MRKFLTYFGAVALVLVLLVAGLIGWFAYSTSVRDAEATAFLDTAIPAIAKNWNKDEFLIRATPELAATLDLNDVTTLFKAFSRLGPLVKYLGSIREGYASVVSVEGRLFSITYVASASFDYGTATFHAVVVKRNGRWAFQSFFVKPVIDVVPDRST